MNAEQYLHEALGGNMNISTLKPLAWYEIMDGYANQKMREVAKCPGCGEQVVVELCPSCKVARGHLPPRKGGE